MWLCFNDGFVSAVQNWDDASGLVVRARRAKILTKLFPKAEIKVTTDSDYRYRVFVSKEEFAKIVTARITDISYSNFKSSVEDGQLHELYAAFWRLHHRYQR